MKLGDLSDPGAVALAYFRPSREVFAIARASDVTIHRGWGGAAAQTLKWPTGLEGVPRPFDADPIQGTPIITKLIPFDDGDRVLLVSPEGVFVMSANGAVRLLPTQAQMREHFEFLQREYPNDPLHNGVSMEHGAISPDGKLIACGHQCSLHYVFDADSLEIIGEIGHLSEYW